MSVPSTSATHQFLPDEIWLQVLCHLDSQDLWLNIRKVNKQLRACAEDHGIRNIVPDSTVGVTFSLGSNTQHRWYDIRGTLTFNCLDLDPQGWYARLDLCRVHPQGLRERAIGRWSKICSDGLDPKQEWRVQCGVQGEMRRVRLPGAVARDGNEVHVHWREMLDVYYGAGPDCK